MFAKFTTLLSVSMVCSVGAQTACSPKIKDEKGVFNSCEFFQGKSDTNRMIFTIGLARPHFSEENLPENQAKLRKWTDSLFLKYDLRYIYASDQRAQPPPDSLINWNYQWLLIQKGSVLAIAVEDFVKELTYREKPPGTSVGPSGARNQLEALARNPAYFDIKGRLIAPSKVQAINKSSWGASLFMRE